MLCQIHCSCSNNNSSNNSNNNIQSTTDRMDMSVRMGSHLMSDDDDDDDTLNNLMKFCVQLLNYTQWRLIRQFMCGSAIEIRLCHVMCKLYHINEDIIDQD